MKGILSTAWGLSLVASLVGAIMIAAGGLWLNIPATVTVFAAVNLATCLVALVLLASAVSVILRSSGTQHDVGATLEQELETPAGQAELKQMGFSALLTVALVQELHQTLVKRDEPFWFLEFFGDLAGESFNPVHRYFEGALLIGAAVFAAVIGLLIAVFGYTTGASIYVTSTRQGVAAFLCGASTCLIGGILALAMGLFGVSVIRRLSVLYAVRAEERKGK